MKLDVGSNVGRWTIEKKISDRGGNGVVWQVSDGIVVGALKVLKRKHLKDETRKERFSKEIKSIIACQNISGVLPVLDHQLGDSENPDWLVTKLATPLTQHLGQDYSLQEVVTACCFYSNTLSEMHKRAYSHRDIKPENLFFADGEYLIGDFGLVDLPEKDIQTPPNEKVGPIFYMAPEMLQNIGPRYSPKADVWSLAKLIWKLGTKQSYPIEGKLGHDIAATKLSTYVMAPRADQLDKILASATEISLDHRITMSQFCSELQAWLREQPASSSSAVGEVSTALKEHISDLYSKARTEQELQELASAKMQEKAEELKSILSGTPKQVFEKIEALFQEIGLSEKIYRIGGTTFDILTRSLAQAGDVSTEKFAVRNGLGCYVYPPVMSDRFLSSFCAGAVFKIPANQNSTKLTYGFFADHFGRNGFQKSGQPIWLNSTEFVINGPAQAEELDLMATQLLDNFEGAVSSFLEIIKNYKEVRRKD